MTAPSPSQRYYTTAPLRLLVIEDNLADQRLIEQILRGSAIAMEAVASVSAAEARLSQGRLQDQSGVDSILPDLVLPELVLPELVLPDLVLLDLGLSGNQGLDDLARLLETAPGLPVVVMTCLDDDSIGLEALSVGAEDFLQKARIDDPALVQRTLRFAWERNRLRRRLQVAEREQELLAMGRIGASTKLRVSASAFGLQPLKENDADLFAELRESYGRILRAAAERQVYQVDYPVSRLLRELADRLGFLRASPRDLIDLHASALAVVTDAVGPAHERLLASEGRITILELMGYLASYYRRYYVGSMGARAAKP